VIGEEAPLDVASHAPIEHDPPPAQDSKDRIANGSLLARWAPETRAMLVMEFIAEKKLFAELNAFLKRRIR
jgi:hypothetical protein